MILMPPDVEHFSKRYLNRVATWRGTLKRIEDSRYEAVVWGAGSKGVTFLNSLQVKDQIKFVIDLDPKKEGNYVPGTGQKIPTLSSW
jgi:hypothetical protein